jgi:hypothetical protein
MPREPSIKEPGDFLSLPPPPPDLSLAAVASCFRLAAVIEDAKTGDVFNAPVGLGFKAKKMYEEFFLKK